MRRSADEPEPPDSSDEDPVRAQQEMSRRDALKIMATGAALAQTAGCLRAPGEDIRPYAKVPPELRPGTPQIFATSLTRDGFATGVLVTTHEGRPTKIDGNPAHPASLGGSTALEQAAIFGLYDPYRTKAVLEAGLPASWARALERLAALPEGELWLVLPPQTSALVAEQLARVAERHPGTHVVFHAVAERQNAYSGAWLAWDAPLEQQLDLARAEVVLALDADPLASMPMAPRRARDFAGRRRVVSPADEPNRLYVVEPMPTPTGTLADHRLARPAGEVLPLLVALADELGRRGVALPFALPEAVRAAAARRVDTAATSVRTWLAALAEDLAARRGASAIVVGDRQPPACHALAQRLDLALGNLGHAVSFTASALVDVGHGPGAGRSLDELAQAIRARQVGTVVVLDTNPVYASPGGLDLAARLDEVPLSLHLTRHVDETARACRWVLPATHELEAWGDARAVDGTRSFAQPLLRPLRRAQSPLELLAVLAGERHPDARTLLRTRFADVDVDGALGLGLVAGSAAASVTPAPREDAALVDALARALHVGQPAPPLLPLELELDLATSPAIHDGSVANTTWLQELPHPITKQTWGNAALVSPRTAARLRLGDGQVVELRLGGRTLAAPALAVPGHADGSVTLELGYGRRALEEPFADGVGVSGFALVGEDEHARVFPGLELRPLPRHQRLARTQASFSDEGRGLAPHADLDTFRHDPGFARAGAARGARLPTLLADRPPPPVPRSPSGATTPTLQWAMSIDTTICSGCSACVIACQAENNVPTVGPDEVRRGREMHWLRIDTYHFDDDRTVVHQPMLCQHCEHAPCEYVCPVFATTHSPDGLNEMVYNRCVGTRFCSNNCPYKVRRFNWFEYTRDPGTLALQRNPGVTVRGRGVMEKCTYCVQRIRAAEIQARVEKRAIRAGEVVTACQQACPTGAIQFGALEHADGELARRRQEPRHYAVLAELGTRPRTTYLAKIRNPRPPQTDAP